MKENSKLILALVIFLMISIIILPTIIGKGGLTNIPKNDSIPSDTIQNENIPTEIYKFTKNNLNMRTGPGIDNEKITTIPIGHKVQVIGHENGWDKVIYKENTGYSSSDYLSEYLEDVDEDILKENSNTTLDTTLVNNQGVEVVEYMKEINGILLVNKEYGLPKNYYPGVNPEAKDQLEKMFSLAKKDIKKELVVFSGFRSYNYQEKLYTSYLVSEGKEDTSLYNAEPGHSEHQTGLAFDIGGEMKYWMDESFAGTIEGIWLRDNAHNFGFILRYPEGKTDVTGYGFEPWHFRYIGIEHAIDIFKNNLTLEEYLLKSL